MQNGLMMHLKKVTLVALSIGLLGGCMPSQTEEKKVITILYSSVSDFKITYGNSLQSKFDQVDFQIIEYNSILGDGLWNGFDYVPTSGNDWNGEEFVKLVREKKTDIIYFPVSIYPSLLNENLLKDLSVYSSQYDFSEIDTPIMEALQRMGEGRLYFLSDSLASQAIYYNKEIKDYSNEEISIYVSEFEEPFFYRSYGNLILDHFPGLEIRVITETNHTNGDMKVEEIKKQSPDLIISHAYVYKKLVADSYLMNLDTLIKEDRFELDKYAENMISALRDDNGLLYGLSPDIYITGVFYNKSLFSYP
jgi:hypothetical protein